MGEPRVHGRREVIATMPSCATIWLVRAILILALSVRPVVAQAQSPATFPADDGPSLSGRVFGQGAG